MTRKLTWRERALSNVIDRLQRRLDAISDREFCKLADRIVAERGRVRTLLEQDRDRANARWN